MPLVDLADVEGGAVESLETVEEELGAFDRELLNRPRLLVGTKLDAAVQERQVELREAAEGRGLRYLEISSVTGRGTDQLVSELRQMLEGEPQT